MNKFSFKGIVLAVLAVLALDSISSLVMTVFMGSHVFTGRGGRQQMYDAMVTMALNTNFLWGCMILGTLIVISLYTTPLMRSGVAKNSFTFNELPMGVVNEEEIAFTL